MYNNGGNSFYLARESTAGATPKYIHIREYVCIYACVSVVLGRVYKGGVKFEDIKLTLAEGSFL